MNIVHINTHDVAGGAAKVAWRLSEEQRSRGDNATLLVGYKTSGSPFSFSFDPEPDLHQQDHCKNTGRLFYEFQGSHKLPHHHLVRAADVVHLHNLHGWFFNPSSISALSITRPTVWTLHDMQSITGHCAHSFDCERYVTGCGDCPYLYAEPALEVDTTAQLWADKKAIYSRSVLHIVTPSQWLKNKVERSILKDHPVEVIYNGVDTSIFRPYNKGEIRTRLGIPQEALVVGSVAHGGVSNKWKGGREMQATLDALWQRFPEMVFLNIGGTASVQGGRSISTGHIDDESTLARLYSCLDAFIYTPVADNCPLVLLEALACAVPIVSFNVGGVPEIARHGSEAFIVGGRDIGSMADAVAALHGDPALKATFATNARSRAVGVFDHGVVCNSYYRAYASAADYHHRQAHGAKRPSIASSMQVIIPQPAPSIAVVTPSYNQAQYLEECVDSVLSQNYRNLEFIIMDGGSMDGSVEIIKKYEKHLSYWRSCPDGGQYAAIDAGLKRSTGDLMTWLNSDDKFHPGAFGKVAAVFGEYPEVHWLMGRPNGLSPDGTQLWVLDHLPLWSQEKYLRKEYRAPYIQQEGTFWRRALWDRAGGFMARYLDLAGDLELWARFFRYAQLHSVDALLAGYRQHPGQKMATQLAAYNTEAELILDREIELHGRRNLPLLPAPLPIII